MSSMNMQALLYGMVSNDQKKSQENIAHKMRTPKRGRGAPRRQTISVVSSEDRLIERVRPRTARQKSATSRAQNSFMAPTQSFRKRTEKDIPEKKSKSIKPKSRVNLNKTFTAPKNFSHKKQMPRPTSEISQDAQKFMSRLSKTQRQHLKY